jgi:hypothetical protein
MITKPPVSGKPGQAPYFYDLTLNGEQPRDLPPDRWGLQSPEVLPEWWTARLVAQAMLGGPHDALC